MQDIVSNTVTRPRGYSRLYGPESLVLPYFEISMKGADHIRSPSSFSHALLAEKNHQQEQ